MVASMRHEPFYETARGRRITRRVCRWCVRKHSFSDGMRCITNSGRVLVFAGEEFPSLAPPAPQGARTSVRHGSPEYLVHRAEEESSFPATLNGRFHGLLVDLTQRTRRCSTIDTDERIYFHESKRPSIRRRSEGILAVRPSQEP